MSRYTYHRPRPVAAFLAALGLVFALVFGGCRASKDTPQADTHVGQSDKTDTTRTQVGHSASTPAEKPGLLSGIGNLFSTPEGRANRQAVKLAKAQAGPSKIKVGKGGQYAPNANQAVNGGNKPTAPVTNADSGAVVSNAAENAQQQTAKGDGNDMRARKQDTTQEAPGPLAVLADNATKWVPYAVLAGLVLTAFVVWRKRKNKAENMG